MLIFLAIMTTIVSRPYHCADGRELNIGRWWTEPVAIAPGEHIFCGGNLPVEGKVGTGTNTCVTVNVDSCKVTPLRRVMQTARQGVQPVCLTNGQCLLFGGNTNDATPASLRIDRLRLNNQRLQSTSLQLSEPCMATAAARLADGRVLITGGFGLKDPTTGKGPVLGTALLLNPQSGRKETITMHHQRGGHSATVLPDGRVLIVGGIGDDPSGAEVFDPKRALFDA
ncbi:MAG: hypothetical protein HYV03_04855, partial [Deltaproteobacteria bacterium]|nr:hypothetical protein [Deltaproteobacteria bacterium]